MLYLYVKQHTKTKLKYFGKTTRDPYKYRGSGSYWKKHIRKHGVQHVVTIDLWAFNDQEKCTKFALTFSKNNNIIESNDWANLIDEDGRGGRGIPGRKQTLEERQKRSDALVGKPKTEAHKQKLRKPKRDTYNMKKSEETRLKMSKPKTIETRIKMSGRIWITNGIESIIIKPENEHLYPAYSRGRVIVNRKRRGA